MRTKTIEAGCQAIEALDLSAVKRKIMEPQPEGKGWTQEQADEAERWYRRYLELCLRYPDVAVVPNYAIDAMWHQHILDTRAYADDCQAIFGEMLHHYPYYGLNGDAWQRDSSFDETNELYRKHFGTDCLDMKEFSRNMEDAGRCTERPCEDSCQASRSPVANHPLMVEAGVNCCGGGSGTGCRQGCRRGG